MDQDAPTQHRQASPQVSALCGFWLVIVIFAVTRLIVWCVAYTVPEPESRPWWSGIPLVRWDGGHYRAIMLEGYGSAIGERVAFFPAYPLIARPLVGWLGPDRALVTVSHLAALAAVCLAYCWALRYVEPRTAVRFILLLCVYPPAMFLSTAYSDAVLLLCVALILVSLGRRHVLMPAVISGFATAVRPTGMVVAAVVWLWECVHTAGRPIGRRLMHLALVGCICVSGLVAYECYLWRHFHRADAFFAAQEAWRTKPPPDALKRVITLKPILQPLFRPVKYLVRGTYCSLFGGAHAGDLGKLLDPQVWNPLFNALLVVAGVVGFLRPGPLPRVVYLLSVLVFLQAYIMDPVNGGRLVGIARYQLIALPSFLLLASRGPLTRSRLATAAVAVPAMAFQCVYAAGFANWRMVG